MRQTCGCGTYDNFRCAYPCDCFCHYTDKPDKFAAMAEKIYGDHRDGMEVINAITEALRAVEKEAREDESKKMQEISELRVQQAYERGKMEALGINLPVALGEAYEQTRAVEKEAYERGQNSQTFELYELHRSDGTIEKWSEDFEARITREARTAALEEAAKALDPLYVVKGSENDGMIFIPDAQAAIRKLKGDLK